MIRRILSELAEARADLLAGGNRRKWRLAIIISWLCGLAVVVMLVAVLFPVLSMQP